jgi:glutamyl-tRNA reductase
MSSDLRGTTVGRPEGSSVGDVHSDWGQRLVTHASAWSAGTLLAVGVNHHTAPLEIRERLTLDSDRWQQSMSRVPHLYLATCNRTEAYLWDTERGTAISSQVAAALANAGGFASGELSSHVFVRRGYDALLHMVRVASGLDSMLVGEEQILVQLRSALRLAGENGTSSPPLHGVVSLVLGAGRRIRTETNLGRRSSLASAAVAAVQRTPELSATRLAGRHAIVLGAGAMARSAARALVETGAHVSIVNRTLDHARRLADELGRAAQPAGFAALPELLARGSVVVAATRAQRPVLDTPTVRAAMARRHAAPLILIDVALPRNIEPAVRALPNVRLIDLDDLERLCPAAAALRRAEIEQAELLAVEAAQTIARWLRVRAVSPAIVELRRQADAVRTLEMRRVAQRLAGLTPEQHSAVAHLTEAIVNKLLHGPTVALREAAAGCTSTDPSQRVLDVLRLDRARHARLEAST